MGVLFIHEEVTAWPWSFLSFLLSWPQILITFCNRPMALSCGFQIDRRDSSVSLTVVECGAG